MRQLRHWWAEQSRNTRVALFGAVGVLVVGGVLGAALALSSGGGEPGEGPVGVSVSAAGAVGAEATAGGSGSSEGAAVSTVPPIDDTPENLASLRTDPRLPTVNNIRDLHSRYGQPPDAKFGRFRIPTLGVDAPLGGRVVGNDGYMKGPAGPSDVVWYDFSRYPELGGLPGTGGNAVFSGHVDYAARIPYANVNFRGEGVFFSLGLLSQGDQVEVEWFGRTYKYQVTSRRTMPANGTNWNEVLSKNANDGDSITLITCAGQFDERAMEYSDRMVVRAVRLT